MSVHGRGERGDQRFSSVGVDGRIAPDVDERRDGIREVLANRRLDVVTRLFGPATSSEFPSNLAEIRPVDERIVRVESEREQLAVLRPVGAIVHHHDEDWDSAPDSGREFDEPHHPTPITDNTDRHAIRPTDGGSYRRADAEADEPEERGVDEVPRVVHPEVAPWRPAEPTGVSHHDAVRRERPVQDISGNAHVSGAGGRRREHPGGRTALIE